VRRHRGGGGVGRRDRALEHLPGQCAGDGSRALARLAVRPDEVLVDGKPIATLGVPHHAVVGGDAKCYSIACASIVAKVVRDRLMTRLAARHPAYGWERNAGYGTPTHIAALRVAGLTPHHRLSFCRTRPRRAARALSALRAP
jgi:ribonuclease HII